MFKRNQERRSAKQMPALERRQNNRRTSALDWLKIFHNTDEAAVMKIIGECEVIGLPAGTPLLKAGDINDCVYLLLSGKLAVHLDNTLTADTAIPIEPGSSIGEMSVLDGNPASASVTALSDARVLKLPKDVFKNELMAIPGVAGNMMVALSERMRHTNDIMLETQRKQLILEHLNKELDVARQLQMGMLPLHRPLFPGRADIEVEGLMEPASSVGGDLFDVFFVGDNQLFFCIGDVSGHGISAALFMARAIGLIRVSAMSVTHPGELLARINDHLCAGNDTNMFATLFCGFLDIKTGRLSYSNGGHCAPLLLHDDDVSTLPIPKGALTGVMPGLIYTANEIVLEQGDTLICYTDGVTEAQTKTGEEFSVERLQNVITKNADQMVGVVLDAVRQEVTNFTGYKTFDDDCTMLAIRRL